MTETEAFDAIEKYCTNQLGGHMRISFDCPNEEERYGVSLWWCSTSLAGPFFGRTRLEALTAAAKGIAL